MYQAIGAYLPMLGRVSAKRLSAKQKLLVQAVTTLGFVAASQEEPYGDIILTPGPMYGVESF